MDPEVFARVAVAPSPCRARTSTAPLRRVWEGVATMAPPPPPPGAAARQQGGLRSRASTPPPAPRRGGSSSAASSSGPVPAVHDILATVPREAALRDPLVNRRVKKWFNGFPYAGTIVGVDRHVLSGEVAYHIRYDDSDEEHVSAQEVGGLLQAALRDDRDQVRQAALIGAAAAGVIALAFLAVTLLGGGEVSSGRDGEVYYSSSAVPRPPTGVPEDPLPAAPPPLSTPAATAAAGSPPSPLQAALSAIGGGLDTGFAVEGRDESPSSATLPLPTILGTLVAWQAMLPPRIMILIELIASVAVLLLAEHLYSRLTHRGEEGGDAGDDATDEVDGEALVTVVDDSPVATPKKRLSGVSQMAASPLGQGTPTRGRVSLTGGTPRRNRASLTEGTPTRSRVSLPAGGLASPKMQELFQDRPATARRRHSTPTPRSQQRHSEDMLEKKLLMSETRFKHPSKLRKLMEMGVREEEARVALALNNGDIEQSLLDLGLTS